MRFRPWPSSWRWTAIGRAGYGPPSISWLHGYRAVLVVVRAENAAPELLQRPSMPFEVLSFVPYPPTTGGEARGVAALAAARGWRRILVVTSTLHITRARLIFERALDCEVVFASAGMNSTRAPRYVLSETAKLLLALTLRRAS